MGVVFRNFTRCELHYGHWNVGFGPICLSIGDWRHACVSQSDDGQLGKGSHVIGRGWGRLSLGWRGKKCCGPVVITDSRVLEETYGSGVGRCVVRRVWPRVWVGQSCVSPWLVVCCGSCFIHDQYAAMRISLPVALEGRWSEAAKTKVTMFFGCAVFFLEYITMSGSSLLCSAKGPHLFIFSCKCRVN